MGLVHQAQARTQLLRRFTWTSAKGSTAETPTFYRRALPPALHSFTSPTGKELFTQALLGGHANIYFPLSGNLTMQSEPAYCGLGSLVMVLNALSVDPGRRWKGVWRWYGDDMLECTPPLETVRQNGLTFKGLGDLARCNGLSVKAKRADSVSEQEFLEDLRTVTASTDLHMVVSFSRKALGQTGDGHFSPIGAFHSEKNSALVLDVARFKYPSYWANASDLYKAMHPIDSVTGLPRGYFLLSRPSSQRDALCLVKLQSGVSRTDLSKTLLKEVSSSLSGAHTIDQVLSILSEHVSNLVTFAKPGIDLAGGEGLAEDYFSKELETLKRQAMFHPLSSLLPQSSASLTTTIAILSLPDHLLTPFLSSPELKSSFSQLRYIPTTLSVLKDQVQRITEQFHILLNDHCRCGSKKK